MTQLLGISDPDLDDRVSFAGLSALPADVLWHDASTGGSTPSAGSLVYQSDGQLLVTAGDDPPGTDDNTWLLFDLWTMDYSGVRRVWFEIEGLAAESGYDGLVVWRVADRATQTARGGHVLARSDSGDEEGEIAYSNGSLQTYTTDWRWLEQRQPKPLTLGLLYERLPAGWRQSVTLNGTVIDSILPGDLAMGELTPMLLVHNRQATAVGAYTSGARRRIWR